MFDHRNNQNENPKMIDLRNVSIENDDHIPIFKITISDTLLEIKTIYLENFSKSIQEKYLNKSNQKLLEDDIKRYQEKYDIEDRNVIIFFNIIQEKKTEISNDQFFDLCKLANLFEVKKLKISLQQYAQANFENVDFILNCLAQNEEQIKKYIFTEYNDEYSIQLESVLASKINECLQNPNFGKLHISRLYRIFSLCNKESIDCNLAFAFICQSIKVRSNLLYFINYPNLSKKNLDRLYNLIFNQDNQSTNLYLQLSYEFYKSLFDENRRLLSEVNLHNIENDQFQSQKQQLEKNIKQFQLKSNEIDNMQNQINILTDANKQYKSQINKLQNINHMNEQKIQEMNQNHLELDNKIKETQKKEMIHNTIMAMNNCSNDPYLLLSACESGNIDVVKYLVSEKLVDINLKSVFCFFIQ